MYYEMKILKNAAGTHRKPNRYGWISEFLDSLFEGGFDSRVVPISRQIGPLSTTTFEQDSSSTVKNCTF